MRNRLAMPFAAAFLGIILAGVGSAQGAQPKVPGGGMPTAMGRSAQMPKGFEDFMPKVALMQAASEITVLDASKSHALSRVQARKALAILAPLRDMPKLSPAQARSASEKLQKLITPAQHSAYRKIFTEEMRKAMAQMKAQGKIGGKPSSMQKGNPYHPGMAHPVPGGGLNGAKVMPRGSGNHHFDMQKMKYFNPFYAKGAKSGSLAQRRSVGWDRLFGELRKKANGK